MNKYADVGKTSRIKVKTAHRHTSGSKTLSPRERYRSSVNERVISENQVTPENREFLRQITDT